MSDPKFKLSPEDLKRINHANENNQINRYLREKANLNFKVGDILIKKKRKYNRNGGDHTWEPETVSDRSPTPKKYYYAFENELGVGYIKQIKSDGGSLCESLICLADVDYTWSKFEVDPDFVDHMLLVGEDEEFGAGDGFNEKRKERNKIHAKNRKIAVRITSELEAHGFLSALKAGDEFWLGHDLYTATLEKHTVVTSTTTPVGFNQYYHPKPTLSTIAKVETKIVKTITSEPKSYPGNFDSASMGRGAVVYLTTPFYYEQIKAV
jgi:hypothetical protein